MAKTKKQFNLKPIGTDQPAQTQDQETYRPLKTGREGESKADQAENNKSLTASEQSELALHEQVIEAGMDVFLNVGIALATIQKKKLYRQHYDTFEAYCDGRYELTRRRAYQLIEAAAIVQSLAIEVARDPTVTITILPKTEAHAAALSEIAPDERATIWQEVVAESQETGKAITAKKIRQRVASKHPQAEPDKVDPDKVATLNAWLDAKFNGTGKYDRLDSDGSEDPLDITDEPVGLKPTIDSEHLPYLHYSSDTQTSLQSTPVDDPSRLDTMQKGIDALVRLFDGKWTTETVEPLLEAIPALTHTWKAYIEQSEYTYDAWWGCWTSFTAEDKRALIDFALRTANSTNQKIRPA
jgi:hypothetical protein